jgi:hypothetical protein
MSWNGNGHASPESVQNIAQQLMRAFGQRDEAFRDQNWRLAELVGEEEVRLGRQLLLLAPTTDNAASLGISLWYLGRALIAMGAGPEAEVPLQESVSLLRRYGRFDTHSSDPDLIDALAALAEVYGGAQYYFDRTRGPFSTVDAMKEYRRERLSANTWDGLILTASSDEWQQFAEQPLLESIEVARDLARTGDESWVRKLAAALYAYGASLITLGSHTKAKAPLLEADALYTRLLRYDHARYARNLSLTRQRLREVESVFIANAGSHTPKDSYEDVADGLGVVRLDGEPPSLMANGKTQLMFWAAVGDEDNVRALIQRGVDVNAGDDDGDTALYYAISSASRDMVELLLSHGANPNICGSNGVPLRLAAGKGWTEIVRSLISGGARVDARSSVATTHGVTALMVASGAGHVECVQTLLAHGADPQAVDADGDSALFYARSNGQHSTSALLQDQ